MSENLQNLQNWMQTAILTPKNRHEDSIVANYIAPAKVLTPTESLAIYQRSYYSRLLECMRGQFKALEYTLENGLFEEFCNMYIRQYPSESPNLGDLGERFPAFLEEIRPDKAQPERWIDFMIAMAKFEVDLYRIFDIEGSEGFIFANLQTTDKELTLQKCIDFQEYPFDVNTYYQKVAAQEQPEITEACKSYIVFIRSDYQVYVISVTKLQFHLLKAIKKHNDVEKALLSTASFFAIDYNILLADWNTWRTNWIMKGFFLDTLKNKAHSF